MVSKCANPECSTPLRYLRDGKIFRIEVEEDSTKGKKPVRRVEHFWLCGECAQTMSISFSNDRQITIVPKERPLYRGAFAAAS
jgi:hypothetical protein